MIEFSGQIESMLVGSERGACFALYPISPSATLFPGQGLETWTPYVTEQVEHL